MEFRALMLPGCYEIRLEPHYDERGYFMRTYDREIFHMNGLTTDWLQENQSMSLQHGTLRGLHFQRPPFAEAKLVRALAGAVLDVFVDLRTHSPTFGQWETIELAVDQFNMVFIPKGFAHGFCSLTDDTVVTYHVDACYMPQAEGGLRWDDETLQIPWPVASPIVSAKDQALPLFRQFVSPFTMVNLDKAKDDAHV